MRGVWGVCSAVLGVVALGALAPMVGSAAVAPPPGLVYAGDDAQHDLVVLQLSATGKQVKTIEWTADSPCTAGPGALPDTPTHSFATGVVNALPINKAGAFKKTGTFTATGANGSTLAFKAVAAGRKVGGNMVGTVQNSLTETSAAGAVMRSCDSGPIKFKIANANVFGGLTVGQLNPIAVTMNPKRTRVTRLRWDWQATCTLGPAAKPDTSTDVYFPDSITGFPVDKLGRWGATLNFPAQADPASGISTAFDYKITAKRTGVNIKGTITSSIVETDTATGGEVRRCASGPIKFAIRD